MRVLSQEPFGLRLRLKRLADFVSLEVDRRKVETRSKSDLVRPSRHQPDLIQPRVPDGSRLSVRAQSALRCNPPRARDYERVSGAVTVRLVVSTQSRP